MQYTCAITLSSYTVDSHTTEYVRILRMSKIWKIFAPHTLFGQESSYLFGKVCSQSKAVFITATTTNVRTASQLSEHLNLIGSWEETPDMNTRVMPRPMIWIKLFYDCDGEINCVAQSNSVHRKCTLVIFDAVSLLKSAILYEKNKIGVDDNLTMVYRTLQSTNQIVLENKMDDHDVMLYGGKREKSRSALRKLLGYIPFVTLLLYLPFWPIKIENRQGKKGFVQKALTTPTTVNQLICRAQDLKHTVSEECCRRYNDLRIVDSCCRQLLDTALGLLLMFVLMQGDTAQNIADKVLTYGDIVALELKTLLHWLMGAPAGLKLNSQLTHLLSQFFQYHIYLWTGYLFLLKPVLGFLVYYSSIAGIWGLTVQLSLYQDIFSTLTLHIYCFYVYAARLYRLQLYALASFWRLFRGKKWNVLRQRVDSAVYDADQLFLGTLLFTVLLFLLPTTLIYYVVFTLLRLLVLMMQFAVGKLRKVLNTLPVWLIWLWISRSPLLTDGASFHIHKSKSREENKSCFILSMQMTMLDLNEVMTLTRDSSTSASSLDWSTFCKNLVYGDLVFPWIEKKKTIS